MNWFSKLLGGAGAATLTPEQRARLTAWRCLPAVNLELSHRQTRYVVVDIESSGLDQGRDRLISIGAVAIEGGLIHMSDAFEVVLRQAEVSANDNILIHGIGADAQREGVDPAEALLQFLEYIGKAPLLAYHAFFDQGMIDRASKRFIGIRPPLVWIDLAWILPEVFRERIDGVVGLDQWLAQFRITNFQRHNAVSDCLATAQLFQIAMGRATECNLETPAELVFAERSRRALRRS